MVHALSNSGYSVNVEIVTILYVSLLYLVSRYCTQIYNTTNVKNMHLHRDSNPGSNTISNRLIGIPDLVLIAN